MDQLQKIVIPDATVYDEKGLSEDEKFNHVMKDLSAKKGCRMKGSFDIDRVPGNFHFSCHAYGTFVHKLVNQGYSNTIELLRNVRYDSSHTSAQIWKCDL